MRDRNPWLVSDLAERNLTAAALDCLWVADTASVPAWDFLYLAVVLDASSRQIAGRASATHHLTELVLEALDTAIGQPRSAASIHHHGQGSQYASLDFGKCRDEADVRPSMNSIGSCFDNIICESFLSALEYELLGCLSQQNYDRRTRNGLRVLRELIQASSALIRHQRLLAP